MPGLFPTHIDASGCKYEDTEIPNTSQQVIEGSGTTQSNQDQGSQGHGLSKRQTDDVHGHPKDEGHLEDPARAQMGNAMRESLNDASSMPPGQGVSSTDQVQAVAKCDPQGLIPSICR